MKVENQSMNCIKCNEELESDDNFCPSCGALTPHGYIYYQTNKKELPNKEDSLGSLFTIVALFIVTFTVITIIGGKNILKPYIELKKEIYNLKYGYRTSLMQTDNQYINIEINTKEEAINYIKKDLTKESWQCKRNTNVSIIEKELSESYNIPIINLCDVPLEEAEKIKETITKVYNTFPNIDGYLTNITITNAPTKDEYIAYFEPIYTFVNNNNNIDNYSKVNKTQILLNSYYFINKDTLNKGLNNTVKENHYPQDATFESLIAHELGHYISFVILLKENHIEDITLVTKNNYKEYQDIISILNNEAHSKELLEESLTNYNQKYHTNISLEEYAKDISNYAIQKNNKGNIIYDEVIAEAVHDYYLHDTSSSKSTIEIINVLKERLT